MPRIVIAFAAAPLLPALMFIYYTGQILPVVVLMYAYAVGLGIGVPTYLLMRIAKRTRLRHFLLFGFVAFGLLTFAYTVQAYWGFDQLTVDGVPFVTEDGLTADAWLQSVYYGWLLGFAGALGGAIFWFFAHREIPGRLAGQSAVTFSILALFVASSFLLVRGIDWSGYEPQDLGCHSVGFGGPTRRPSFDLLITEDEWPALRAIFEQVAADFGLSYRDASETRPGVLNLLRLGLCTDNHLQVTVNEPRWVRTIEVDLPVSERGINVFVRALDDDDMWRAITRRLLADFEALWGDRVRFRDADGRLVPRPDDPFAEE